VGIKASDVLESLFRDIAPPRLESASVLRKGIARGDQMIKRGRGVIQPPVGQPSPAEELHEDNPIMEPDWDDDMRSPAAGTVSDRSVFHDVDS
jgi:hypothetical protein